MSEIDVNAVLQQMRSMAALAEGRAAASAEQDAAQRPDFAGLLGKARHGRRDQGGPRPRARPVHDVEHAFRQSRLRA